MRVLTAIAEMGVGGAEAVVESVAGVLLRDGHEIAVASSGGFRADRLGEQGARIVPVPMAGRNPADLVRSVRLLRRELRTHRPELIHVHNVKVAALVRAASLGRRVPALVTLHGVPDGDYASAARLLRRAADRVVAVSADVRDRLTAAGYPAAQVAVVENAVQPLPRHDRRAARARLHLPPDVPVAVCLARLVDQKRHDLLIEAWRSTSDNAVLLVAGDGPNRAAISERIDDAGLRQRVRLLGARTDVDWLLAAADVCVLPTDWEGLPISILEAMAAGVPVVASAVGGLPQALAGAAELVAPNSADALATGIAAVLTDRAHRDRLVTAGQLLIAERFGVDRMCAAYEAEYSRLLG